MASPLNRLPASGLVSKMDAFEQGDDRKGQVEFNSRCIFRSCVAVVAMGTVVAFGNPKATAQSYGKSRRKVVTMRSQTANAIPFVSLGHGDSLNGSDGEAPAILIFGTPAEAAQFTKLLHDQNLIKKIQDTDFKREQVIVVIRGTMANGGYGIRVQRIEGTSKVVKLIVKLSDPAPHQFTQSALTEPYHVIRVLRSSLAGTPDVALAAYTTEGKALVRIKHP